MNLLVLCTGLLLQENLQSQSQLKFNIVASLKVVVNYISFAQAVPRSPLIPYKFKVIDGRLFIPGNRYGTLSTNHFSGTGISKEVTPGEHSCQYCAQVYFTVKHLQDYWYCHFVITKELEMCLTVSTCKECIL